MSWTFKAEFSVNVLYSCALSQFLRLTFFWSGDWGVHKSSKACKHSSIIGNTHLLNGNAWLPGPFVLINDWQAHPARIIDIWVEESSWKVAQRGLWGVVLWEFQGQWVVPCNKRSLSAAASLARASVKECARRTSPLAQSLSFFPGKRHCKKKSPESLHEIYQERVMTLSAHVYTASGLI